MQKIIFALGLSLILTSSFSQNIKELFIQYPESIFGEDPSPENRRKFLESTAVGEFGEYLVEDENDYFQEMKLDILDISNGFMRLTNLEVYWEACYWRKSDGSKLMAVTETTTHGYLESEIRFYLYRNGKWTKLETNSIFPEFGFLDWLDKKATLEANNGRPLPSEEQISYATEIQLPQKGKNIIVTIEFVDSDKEFWEYKLELKKEDKPDSYDLEYIWNDGTFVKE